MSAERVLNATPERGPVEFLRPGEEIAAQAFRAFRGGQPRDHPHADPGPHAALQAAERIRPDEHISDFRERLPFRPPEVFASATRAE